MSYESNYYADEDDFAASESKRLARIRRNKVIRTLLVILFLLGTHFVAYHLGRTALHAATTTTPTPTSSAAPTKPAPTQTAAPTRVPPTPTKPVGWLINEYDFHSTDLSSGGSMNIAVMVRHQGCFKSMLEGQCDGYTVSIKSANGRTLYINDYEAKKTYVVEGQSWVTLVWSVDTAIFFKQAFPISAPPLPDPVQS